MKTTDRRSIKCCFISSYVMLSVLCVLFGCTSKLSSDGSESKAEEKKNVKPECTLNKDCRDKQFCWQETCIPVSGEGGPCETRLNCAEYDKMTCMTNKCVPLSGDGGPCVENADCKDGHKFYCQEGACRVRPTVGEECTQKDVCKYPLKCSSGTCQRPELDDAICNLLIEQCGDKTKYGWVYENFGAKSPEECVSKRLGTENSDYDPTKCLRRLGLGAAHSNVAAPASAGPASAGVPSPAGGTFIVRVAVFSRENGEPWDDSTEDPDPVGLLTVNGNEYPISKHENTARFEVSFPATLEKGARIKVVLKESEALGPDRPIGEAEAVYQGTPMSFVVGSALVQILDSSAVQSFPFSNFRAEAAEQYKVAVLDRALAACRSADTALCLKLAASVPGNSDRAREVRDLASGVQERVLKDSIRKRGTWVEFEGVKFKVVKAKTLEKFINNRQSDELPDREVVPEDGDSNVFLVIECQELNTSNEIVTNALKDGGFADDIEFSVRDKAGKTYKEDNYLNPYYLGASGNSMSDIKTGKSFSFFLFYVVPKSIKDELMLEVSGHTSETDELTGHVKKLTVRIPLF